MAFLLAFWEMLVGAYRGATLEPDPLYVDSFDVLVGQTQKWLLLWPSNHSFVYQGSTADRLLSLARSQAKQISCRRSL
jgi:hypothetical protein